ncbi:transposase [Chryseobacterium sp.]|uniref:transposase n=1 Tax=Chryseobacterium sp. TaxID=1871047 RepID=UPI000EBCDECB|nr:transposase [Chryseobacterium sp.]HCM35932.1 transposase [Chryseobacterium sp.]
MNFKNIHLGKLIQERVEELAIDSIRICKFLKSTEKEIKEMYQSKSLDSEILLRWCKLLEYDFFRVYSQHLILYAPCVAVENNTKAKKSSLPIFRKNIYTKEVIDFILEQISSNKMTRMEVTEKYKIPKTTLYKWISKYKN